MAHYTYVAVGSDGTEARGVLEVASQMEAIKRVREMGLFPTKIKENACNQGRSGLAMSRVRPRLGTWSRVVGRVKPAHLGIFTRQLATMLGAGMSLLRSLRILEEQEECRGLRFITRTMAAEIENGSSFSEAMAAYPRVFNQLYINLVRAGEVGGALETTLNRLADFIEKAQKLRGKLIGAMFYPVAVLFVAGAVIGILLTFVVPTFERVFEGLLEGAPLPAFTRGVFALSTLIVQHLPALTLFSVGLGISVVALGKTAFGSRLLDRTKLKLPLLGPLFRKAAISKFARTLGTLTGNGVPILQALTIVQGATGNLIVSDIIGRVHEQVKQGDPMAPLLRASQVFPPMVAGMIDVGEQTGALPEMLMKIAETYDDEFDNSAKSLTSLLEPLLIVVLAIVVGSIVIAMFLPLITIVTGFDGGSAR